MHVTRGASGTRDLSVHTTGNRRIVLTSASRGATTMILGVDASRPLMGKAVVHASDNRMGHVSTLRSLVKSDTETVVGRASSKIHDALPYIFSEVIGVAI